MTGKRLVHRLFILAAIGLSGGEAGAMAGETTVFVDLDHARIVRMPEGAQTLIIGNPMIADVTMLKSNRLMVITGKSFGSTNLIVLDQTGNQVGESLITVSPPMDKLVVQRGTRRESYACNPDCAPSIDLADDKDYSAQIIEAMKLHEGSSIPVKR
jgi:Flp pilus assembly secretin CpaC